MFEIIPSPGTTDKDFSEVEKKIETIRQFSKKIHIDVIDGKFAANTASLDPTPFAKYTKELVFEAHLMVVEPSNYLKAFSDCGFTRFIGQIEKMESQVEFVAKAQDLGEVGLGVDLNTSLSDIKVSLDDLDSILIMGVQAGFSGQAFNEQALLKVKELRKQTSIPIELDGGINDKTIESCISAGASRFVATSFLFDKDSPYAQFQILRNKLEIL